MRHGPGATAKLDPQTICCSADEQDADRSDIAEEHGRTTTFVDDHLMLDVSRDPDTWPERNETVIF